jgi:hypothetical protein
MSTRMWQFFLKSGKERRAMTNASSQFVVEHDINEIEALQVPTKAVNRVSNALVSGEPRHLAEHFADQPDPLAYADCGSGCGQ